MKIMENYKVIVNDSLPPPIVDFSSLSSFKRTINNAYVNLFKHDIDVLCSFVTCIVSLFVYSLCIFCSYYKLFR